MDTTDKYFLVLTALKDSLPKEKNQNILYIGKWCLPKEKNAKIVYYQFDTIKKNNEAYKYCDSVYENYINQLTSILNNIHNISYDNKSYKIILGNWLKIFIHQLYEKYIILKNVYDTYDIESVSIMDEQDYIIPVEYADYMNEICEDKYNLQQYSQIIDFLQYSNNKIIIKQIQSKQYKINESKKQNIFFNIFKFINRIFKPKVSIVSPYFSHSSFKNYLKLYFSKIGYYNFDSFNKEYIIDIGKINYGIRNNMKFNFSDEFEKLLSTVLANNLPLLFIEGFSQMMEYTSMYDKIRTKVYYTSNALHNNYLYKFFIAKNHKKIINTSHQHGGGYGLDRINYAEEYEKSVTDLFYTWGWSETPLTRFLSHQKNEKINIQYYMNNKSILIPLTGLPRYLHRFQNQYFTSKYISYQNNINLFLNNLSSNIFSNILVRHYPNYYGWDTDKLLLDNFPDLKLDSLSNSFNTTLERCRVVVSLHLSTTWLESISKNIPTLVYIDKSIYQFREKAQKFIDKLYEVNIVFYDIECLVTHLEKYYDDIDKWWLDTNVIEAKEKFVYNYARASDDFTKEWKKEFDRLIEENNDN